MGQYYHAEEEFKAWKVERYHRSHRSAVFDICFNDGERYQAFFADAYDSENGGELDIEMDDPRYDEFHQIVFEITKIIQDGPRRYHEYLSLDYRDFPELITNTKTGEIVYSAQTDPLRKR